MNKNKLYLLMACAGSVLFSITLLCLSVFTYYASEIQKSPMSCAIAMAFMLGSFVFSGAGLSICTKEIKTYLAKRSINNHLKGILPTV